MDHHLLLLSPEKTILTYRLATLGSRVGAHIVDAILVIIAVLCSIWASVMFGSVGQGLALLWAFLLPLGYFVLLEGLWNGQTLGKKMFGLRVRMADGTPITFLAAVGRNFIRPADMLPGMYFVGLIAIFTTPFAQRLGDLIASTVVVHERVKGHRHVAAPHTVGIHAYESAVGELRGMTLDEYNALRRFCDRYPELPYAIQQQLLQDVYFPIVRKRGVPELSNVHPIYLAEAVVMKYGRQHGLL